MKENPCPDPADLPARPRADHRRLVAVLCALLGVISAGFSLVIQQFGGRGPIPTWEQLYAMFGVADSTPEEALVTSGTTVTFLDVGAGDAGAPLPGRRTLR